MNFASSDRRMLAAYIDLVVVLILFLGNYMVFVAVFAQDSDRSVIPSGGWKELITPSLIIYWWLTEWLLGMTIGKFFTKCRVIQLDGSRLSSAKQFTRAVLKTIEIGLLIPILVFHFLSNSNEPVTITDRLLKTRVVVIGR